MEEEILKGEIYLSQKDKILKNLILNNGHLFHKPSTNYFESLCRSIISQQVSVKAAETIFLRFKELTSINPLKVSQLSEVDQKTIGLSRQKLSYVKDISEHFLKDAKIYDHLEKIEDDEVIRELTQIKGVGQWTAQMFLMFTLVRLDIFAPDDIGLQRAIKIQYGLDNTSKKEMLNLSSNWKPYRTIACWHLWKSLNNK